MVLGGTSTTLRGDCQEDCVAHGTGDYLHTGSVLAIVGVPCQSQDGRRGRGVVGPGHVERPMPRSARRFSSAIAQFRPWQSQGFFVSGGMGMAFVRNFVYGETGSAAADHVESPWAQLRRRLDVPAQPIASACRSSARSTSPRSATSRPEASPRGRDRQLLVSRRRAGHSLTRGRTDTTGTLRGALTSALRGRHLNLAFIRSPV